MALYLSCFAEAAICVGLACAIVYTGKVVLDFFDARFFGVSKDVGIEDE